ncbi:MAG TPA: hypothetical protein VGJ70_11495 [Solirubrobacteraceae bacterium]|jgi:hypothetical protein
MLAVILIVAFVLFCIAGALWGAESRPDFLDPRVKHKSFTGPFRAV